MVSDRAKDDESLIGFKGWISSSKKKNKESSNKLNANIETIMV